MFKFSISDLSKKSFECAAALKFWAQSFYQTIAQISEVLKSACFFFFKLTLFFQNSPSHDLFSFFSSLHRSRKRRWMHPIFVCPYAWRQTIYWGLARRRITVRQNQRARSSFIKQGKFPVLTVLATLDQKTEAEHGQSKIMGYQCLMNADFDYQTKILGEFPKKWP